MVRICVYNECGIKFEINGFVNTTQVHERNKTTTVWPNI